MQTTHPPLALPRHRTVAEIMTTEVATTSPETGFKEVATLLIERRVSALPVVEGDGRLVGIVSEADLLPKERRLEAPLLGALRRSWREEHGRAEASVVRDLMTAAVVTVPATATLRHAARLMHNRGVRRLCVTDDSGHLIGIVTRGDLLRGFVRSDDDIAAEIRDGLMVRAMWIDPTGVEVAVHDGLVQLVGEVERRSEAEILPSMTSGLDGVVAVDSQLTWRFDDRGLSIATNARI